jgi:hypothetical protein
LKVEKLSVIRNHYYKAKQPIFHGVAIFWVELKESSGTAYITAFKLAGRGLKNK